MASDRKRRRKRMPIADPSFGWQEAAAAFAIIAVVAFLVTWVVTDVLRVSRTPYVAILALTTSALAAGYIAWSGTSLAELVTQGWGWGVLGGVIAAALVASVVRRLPARPHAEGSEIVRRFLWEGVVYGTAEAILLATLPVLAVWEGADALGWTDTTWAKVGSGVLAVVGALFVIAVHHLGYQEFRARVARKKLAVALAVCAVQALAFLLTGNVLAPVVAHIVLHWQVTLRGIEMPPASDAELALAGPGRALATEAPSRERELVAQG
jgi:TRAP-type C4-dicarboxylate transport system permease large subunit